MESLPSLEQTRQQKQQLENRSLEVECALQPVNEALIKAIKSGATTANTSMPNEKNILRAMTLMASIRGRVLANGWDSTSAHELEEACAILLLHEQDAPAATPS